MSKTSARKHAAKILFDLVVALEPRVKTLARWFDQTFDITQRWYESEGNQGVKRMKDALDWAWRAILKENPQPLSFVRAHDGCPDVVQPLVRRITSLTLDARLLSAVQSLVRLTDLWEGVPEDNAVLKSLDIIENTRLPGTAREEIRRFAAFLPLFFKHYPDAPVSRAYQKTVRLDDDDKYLYRHSRGPNGPLIGTAHLDILSLKGSLLSDGSSLLDEVENLQNLIGDISSFSWGADPTFGNKVLAFSESCDEPISHSETPGKLSLKPEKAGKLRIIAQPDYFSQLTMRPMHNWLMSILQSLPRDCTYNQRSAIPLICAWQLEGRDTYSFDQSACTDRFPFEYQLKVVRNRFGSLVAESMQRVMADRLWEITLPSGRTRKVRWSVGQPLGMYGSWPLMALTHHLFVQYCYWMSRGKTFRKSAPFDRYVICGDDLVIADRPTAREYLRLSKRLGLVINEAKSHLPQKGQDPERVAEFAKVTVWRGKPLFPIKPKLVLQSLKDARCAVPLLFDLAQPDMWHCRRKFLTVWIRKVFPREKNFLTTLLTIPREFGGLGFRDDRSIRRLVAELKPRQIHPLLYYIAGVIRRQIKDNLAVIASHESLFASLPAELVREHPLTEYLREQGQEIQRTLYALGRSVPSVMEVVARMLLRGFEGFPFSKSKETPVLLEYATKHDLRSESLWKRVLNSEHFLPKVRDTRRTMERALCPNPFVEVDDFIHTEGPEWLIDRQVSLIGSVILGKRSAPVDEAGEK